MDKRGEEIAYRIYMKRGHQSADEANRGPLLTEDDGSR